MNPNPFLNLTELHILKGHTNIITAIDICEERNLLVSGCRDRTVKLWNLQNNTLLQTYNDIGLVYDVVFSCQGGYIAYGGERKIVNLINIQDL